MIKLSLQAFKQLDEEDLSILRCIEVFMSRYEYVPAEVISKKINSDLEYVLRKLKRLDDLGLVQRRKGPYIGYMLTSRGYDCLALNTLLKRKVIKGIKLSPLGIGKESDVYEAITFSGECVVVKFHRLGRISFRQTRRYRVYIGDRRHISWLYQARLAAEREFTALNILHPAGVSVPKPIFHNRHVIVMSYISGVPLNEVPPLQNPEEILEKILANISKAYRTGVVHGDLSEYNVITDGEEIIIIDWPQWVDVNHPSAEILLRRDVEVIVKFFRRKYRVGIDVDEALERVKTLYAES